MGLISKKINLQKTDISGSAWEEVNAQGLEINNVSLANTNFNNVDMSQVSMNDINMQKNKIRLAMLIYLV
ncbi:pentapeptide repeat-containing protein [Bacillus suaedae]|uniref:pentapeptide repeat-containing protein n=1 Tax=Halalkalibacter suaedae TaxID=2822140 RepID=UPI001FF093B5|nr:pentapeptide repeat-containing protein [Bacillus suaedae]